MVNTGIISSAYGQTGKGSYLISSTTPGVSTSKRSQSGARAAENLQYCVKRSSACHGYIVSRSRSYKLIPYVVICGTLTTGLRLRSV